MTLCEQAKVVSTELAHFKVDAMSDVNTFVETSSEQYGVKAGGKKGNVTLMSFDGRYKVQRHMQDSITFDERLQAAKELIDECIVKWSNGIDDNIRVLVTHAFQTDKEGKVSISRILGLRRLEITDPTWLRAMAAIADSMQTVGSKPYVRFYERDAAGEYQPINLDVASA